MDGIRYDRRHFRLPAEGQRVVYTAPGTGSRGRPERAREEHAEKLSAQLTAALAQAEEQIASLDEKSAVPNRGVYLELYTRIEWFMPEHFELKGAGILIASAIPVDDDMVRITVFVPYQAFQHFKTVLEKYRTEMSRQGKSPKFANRVERIEEIRFGELASLWTDPFSWFPKDDEPIWWQVWLFADRAEHFTERAQAFDVAVKGGELEFPEQRVRLVKAAPSALERLVNHTDAVSELRRPTARPALINRLDASAQVELVEAVARRTQPAPRDAPALCVLDTGVTHGHPLLEKSIKDEDVHAWIAGWGPQDDDDHGTAMASMVLFGDLALQLTSSDPIALSTIVESVKIFSEQQQVPEPDLYGVAVKDSVALVESIAPLRRRLFVSAIVSRADDNVGLPSEWSAEIDRLASEKQRLFVIAAGNADQGTARREDYPAFNYLRSIADPGQSWNALTVGAYTDFNDPLDGRLSDFQPLAPKGALSPASRTAMVWNRAKAVPVKPDVVFEGGNYAHAPGAETAMQVDDYLCLAASSEYRTLPVRPFGWTSGACGGVAHIAGYVVADQPDLWPETIRALIVHSAAWSPFMQGELELCNTETERLQFLRRYGHGVPNAARALRSARSDATMIIQGTMYPYRSEKGEIKTNEMVTYHLPWPQSLLEELGESRVAMKVTLSYFVEPNPGRRGWIGRYSYPSFGLRFKVRRPGETDEQFRERVNKAERDEDYAASDTTDEWVIGRPRDRGSIHSDTWDGRAADLAQCGVVSVFPISGWWRYLRNLKRYRDPARYALIVSLQAENPDIDIYSAIENRITATIPAAVEIETGR